MSHAVRFLPLVLLVLIVGAMVWRLTNPADTAVRSQLVGKPVPAFEAESALPDRPGLSAADLATGEPRVVNFFASWCVPCVAEAPVLMELKRRGIAIDGLAVRDRPEDIAAFLQRHGDPFVRIGADPQSSIQLALGSAGVPESFVVDGRGIVRLHHVGPIEPHQVEEFTQAVESAR